MKIFAGSVTQFAETFLHPGYISAYPRAIDSYVYSPSGESIEVGEALRLTGEGLASASGVTEGATLAMASTSATGSWLLMVAGVLAFIGAMATAYLLRDRLHHLKRFAGRALVPVGASATAVLIFATCGSGDLPTVVPWEGAELREYENPELATRVILHGIIADGIVNVGRPITTLANIQNEVALPITDPTEGMEYALSTYGIDGWGQEFRLGTDGGYIVTSAGEDGDFDTNDDIAITVTQASDDSFDYGREAFFVRRSGDQYSVIFHRWTGELFEYNHHDLALELTGTGQFDVFTEGDLDSGQIDAVEMLYAEASETTDEEPLILQLSEE